jgi:hypothetical protein
MSKLRAIQTHGRTLKAHHFWLPVPLGVAIAKNVSEDEEDLKRIK